MFVFPPTPSANPSSDIIQTATNGTRINTYGPKISQIQMNILLDIRDGRPRSPDYLQYFGLLVDVKCNRLINPEAQNAMQSMSVTGIHVVAIVQMD